ncbi:hypothetical protein D9M68_947100 [compost metagenome]
MDTTAIGWPKACKAWVMTNWSRSQLDVSRMPEKQASAIRPSPAANTTRASTRLRYSSSATAEPRTNWGKAMVKATGATCRGL